MPTVAIDTTGPQQVRDQLITAVAEVSRTSDIECLVVGDPTAIQAVLDHVSYDPEQIAILECVDGDGLDVGMRALAAGRAEALVADAPAGACVRVAARRLELLRGVPHAGVAYVFPRIVEHPSHDRFAMLLDVEGALATADDLACWAVLGSAYVRRVSTMPTPRVGVLAGSLPDLAALGCRLARSASLTFVGSVSGHDLAGDVADVVVCDGSHGRLARELLETLGRMTGPTDEPTRSWRSGFGLFGAGEVVHPLADRTGYGGAPVLGFDRLILRCDGHADVRTVTTIITLAAKAVQGRVPAEMAAAVAAVA